eukprot:7568508-Prorocentrum_lima.AAC.1
MLHEGISVVEARTFCPPGGALWCSDADQNWQAHYKPFPRVSRSWKKHGNGEALRLCLEYLWEKYAITQGEDLGEVVKFDST